MLPPHKHFTYARTHRRTLRQSDINTVSRTKICLSSCTVIKVTCAQTRRNHDPNTHAHTHVVTDIGRPCGGSAACCGHGCIRSGNTGSGVQPCGGDTSDTRLRYAGPTAETPPCWSGTYLNGRYTRRLHKGEKTNKYWQEWSQVWADSFYKSAAFRFRGWETQEEFSWWFY